MSQGYIIPFTNTKRRNLITRKSCLKGCEGALAHTSSRPSVLFIHDLFGIWICSHFSTIRMLGTTVGGIPNLPRYYPFQIPQKILSIVDASRRPFPMFFWLWNLTARSRSELGRFFPFALRVALSPAIPTLSFYGFQMPDVFRCVTSRLVSTCGGRG
jgi:hypothetical protein